MGLDMYLNGEIYFPRLTDEERKREPILQTFRLGEFGSDYELDDYIMREFGPGDYVNEITLDEEQTEQIIAWVKTDALCTQEKKRVKSRTSQVTTAETLEILWKALEWSKVVDGNWRTVYYYSSR